MNGFRITTVGHFSGKRAMGAKKNGNGPEKNCRSVFFLWPPREMAYQVIQLRSGSAHCREPTGPGRSPQGRSSNGCCPIFKESRG